MEEKYIKFYKTFHKKFKNDENLILCSKTLSDRRMKSLNRMAVDPEIQKIKQESEDDQ